MARKYGVLPSELLLMPYGEFLINMYVCDVGEMLVDQDIASASKGDALNMVLGYLKEL